MLLRALANLVMDYVPGEGGWFTTMERGHYGVHADSDEELARHVIERLVPLASSRLIIDNEFGPTSSRSCGRATRSPSRSSTPA